MFLKIYKKRKRGASLLLVPRSIGLRIAPICRNEQCWKPHVNAYIIHPPYQRTMIRPKPMRAVYNTPCEASPLLCFLTDSWSCEVHRPSKPKRQLRLYLCICIPTLAQSWAFSKDYGCKDNDYFWKLYQKRRENYDNFLSYLPQNEFICLILMSNEADKSYFVTKFLMF